MDGFKQFRGTGLFPATAAALTRGNNLWAVSASMLILRWAGACFMSAEPECTPKTNALGCICPPVQGHIIHRIVYLSTDRHSGCRIHGKISVSADGVIMPTLISSTPHSASRRAMANFTRGVFLVPKGYVYHPYPHIMGFHYTR